MNNMLSPEQQLAGIISAQVKGGYKRFEFGSDEINFDNKGHAGFWCHNLEGEGQFESSILAFLLDPAGLKAAYGERGGTIETGDERKDMILNSVRDTMIEQRKIPAYWETVSIMILLSWNESNGDAAATIQTAYNLLPTSHGTNN